MSPSKTQRGPSGSVAGARTSSRAPLRASTASGLTSSVGSVAAKCESDFLLLDFYLGACITSFAIFEPTDEDHFQIG